MSPLTQRRVPDPQTAQNSGTNGAEVSIRRPNIRACHLAKKSWLRTFFTFFSATIGCRLIIVYLKNGTVYPTNSFA
jgi:hypothetical protein